jgi:hypothetical protein
LVSRASDKQLKQRERREEREIYLGEKVVREKEYLSTEDMLPLLWKKPRDEKKPQKD